MNFGTKKLIFNFSAKFRSVAILRLVRKVYTARFFGNRLSGKIEKIFDPNNIRRRVTSKIIKTKVFVKTTTGCVLELHLDEHIDWKTFLDGDFDSLCLSEFLEISKKSGTIWTLIDIGANIGTISVPIGKSHRVIAFEPQKELALRLSNNLELNSCVDCRVETFALTSPDQLAVSDMGVLFRPIGNSGATSFIPSWNPSLGEPERIDVRLTTLDIYYTKNLNFFSTENYFLKVDVEGGELNVLKGASNFILKNRPFIFLEYRPDLMTIEMSKELLDYISNLSNYCIRDYSYEQLEYLSPYYDSKLIQHKYKVGVGDLLIIPVEKKHMFFDN
jgi:FkbM family methyltransferase